MAKRRSGSWKVLRDGEAWINRESVEGQYNNEKLIIKSNNRGAWVVFSEIHVNGEDFSKIRDTFGNKGDAQDYAHDFKDANPHGSDPDEIRGLRA